MVVKTTAKAQSAMEYLMTYGWAILIIAVVLAALFQLGIFGGIGTPKAQPGNCRVVKVGSGITQTISLAGECQGQEPEFVAQFNGQSSNILLTGTARIGIPRSMSVWVYETQQVSPSLNSPLVDATDTCPGDSFILSPTGQPAVDNCGVGGNNPTATNTISHNIWTNVAYTYDGSNVIFYIDGIPAGTVSNGALYSFTTGVLIIGHDPGTYCCENQYLMGSMSNLQIYNTSLSQAEIVALYREGIGGAPIDPQHIVGWWPLNGDENDYSSNGNNGVPNVITFSSSWTSGYTAP